MGGIAACVAVCVTVGVFSSVAGASSYASCAATPVRNGEVKAGPFTGLVVPEYDVVAGRFRLHVGPYRDRATGLSQKIPWFSATNRVGNRLVVTGSRLHPTPARTFKQTFVSAIGGGGSGVVFPSIISPPSSGCWRLKLQSGRVSSFLTVRVTP